MAKIDLFSSPDYQTSFESVGLLIQENKFNTDFQDGGHLGFSVRMTFTTFVQNTSTLQMRFRVNWPFGSG